MAGMSQMKYWPLAGLRVPTPRPELRLPNSEDLGALAVPTAEAVRDPAVDAG